ncbi:MAG: hypothetical protein IID33_10130 [Planctomycetes bacterium]|nr:hypothetical protein [Planctomycetota bacterium]
MAPPGRRLRTFTLWTGATLCLLLAAAFVVSAFCQVAFQFSHAVCFYLTGGSLTILLDDPLPAPFVIQPHAAGMYRWDEMATDWTSFAELPLVTLLFAVAVPTLLVQHFVPKFPRGCCRRCGYDLAGNLSGTCPECGQSSASGRYEELDQRGDDK